jgi:hypothetical protein
VLNGYTCATDGLNQSYQNSERCTIYVREEGFLQAVDFNTESGYDFINMDDINGMRYSGQTGPANVHVVGNESFQWTSDGSNTNDGWTICFSDSPFSAMTRE